MQCELSSMALHEVLPLAGLCLHLRAGLSMIPSAEHPMKKVKQPISWIYLWDKHFHESRLSTDLIQNFKTLVLGRIVVNLVLHVQTNQLIVIALKNKA